MARKNAAFKISSSASKAKAETTNFGEPQLHIDFSHVQAQEISSEDAEKIYQLLKKCQRQQHNLLNNHKKTHVRNGAEGHIEKLNLSFEELEKIALVAVKLQENKKRGQVTTWLLGISASIFIAVVFWSFETRSQDLDLATKFMEKLSTFATGAAQLATGYYLGSSQKSKE